MGGNLMLISSISALMFGTLVMAAVDKYHHEYKYEKVQSVGDIIPRYSVAQTEGSHTFTNSQKDDVELLAESLRKQYNSAVVGTQHKVYEQTSNYRRENRHETPECNLNCAQRALAYSFSAKSQEELDNLAREMTLKMINDMNSGKIIESQVSQPEWFEQLAYQKLQNLNVHNQHIVVPTATVNNNYFKTTSSKRIEEYGRGTNGNRVYVVPEVVSTSVHKKEQQVSAIDHPSINYQPQFGANIEHSRSDQHLTTTRVTESQPPTIFGRYDASSSKNVNMEDREEILSHIPTYSDSYFSSKRKEENSENHSSRNVPAQSIHVTFDNVDAENAREILLPKLSSSKSSQLIDSQTNQQDIPIIYSFNSGSKTAENVHTSSSHSHETFTQRPVERLTPRPTKSGQRHSIYKHLQEEVNVQNYHPRVVIKDRNHDFEMRKEDSEATSQQAVENTGSIQETVNRESHKDVNLIHRPGFISYPSRYNRTHWQVHNQTKVDAVTNEQRSVNERCLSGSRYCGSDNKRISSEFQESNSRAEVIRQDTRNHVQSPQRVDENRQSTYTENVREEEASHVDAAYELERRRYEEERERREEEIRVHYEAERKRVEQDEIERRRYEEERDRREQEIHARYEADRRRYEEELERRNQENSQIGYKTDVHDERRREETESEQTYNTGGGYTILGYEEEKSRNRSEIERSDISRGGGRIDVNVNYDIYSKEDENHQRRPGYGEIITGRENTATSYDRFHGRYPSNPGSIGSGNKYWEESERPREISTTTTTTTTPKPELPPPYYNKPPKTEHHSNRGDQPPQHFEEDYEFEEVLEKEPGIGYYPVELKPEIGLKATKTSSNEHHEVWMPRPNTESHIVDESQHKHELDEHHTNVAIDRTESVETRGENRESWNSNHNNDHSYNVELEEKHGKDGHETRNGAGSREAVTGEREWTIEKTFTIHDNAKERNNRGGEHSTSFENHFTTDGSSIDISNVDSELLNQALGKIMRSLQITWAGSGQREVIINNMEDLDAELMSVFGGDEESRKKVLAMLKNELDKYFAQVAASSGRGASGTQEWHFSTELNSGSSDTENHKHSTNNGVVTGSNEYSTKYDVNSLYTSHIDSELLSQALKKILINFKITLVRDVSISNMHDLERELELVFGNDAISQKKNLDMIKIELVKYLNSAYKDGSSNQHWQFSCETNAGKESDAAEAQTRKYYINRGGSNEYSTTYEKDFRYDADSLDASHIDSELLTHALKKTLTNFKISWAGDKSRDVSINSIEDLELELKRVFVNDEKSQKMVLDMIKIELAKYLNSARETASSHNWQLSTDGVAQANSRKQSSYSGATDGSNEYSATYENNLKHDASGSSIDTSNIDPEVLSQALKKMLTSLKISWLGDSQRDVTINNMDDLEKELKRVFVNDERSQKMVLDMITKELEKYLKQNRGDEEQRPHRRAKRHYTTKTATSPAPHSSNTGYTPHAPVYTPHQPTILPVYQPAPYFPHQPAYSTYHHPSNVVQGTAGLQTNNWNDFIAQTQHRISEQQRSLGYTNSFAFPQRQYTVYSTSQNPNGYYSQPNYGATTVHLPYGTHLQAGHQHHMPHVGYDAHARHNQEQTHHHGYGGQYSPDLTQQTQNEDLSQVTVGSQVNPIPAYSRPKYTHEEDLSQLTQSSDVGQQTLASVSELDDLTQQTQKVDYSQVTSGRQVLPPSSSGYGVSRPSYDQEQDLSQLTQNQEFSQLTAGNQQGYRGNSRPGYDQEEDLTQQTQKEDFSQLTAGNQQEYRGRPRPGYDQEEDLTQQTQKEDLSQTTAGSQINPIPAYSRQKYTHEEDLSQLAQSSDVSQQTLASVSELDDLTQQTQKVDYSQVTSGRQVLPPSSSGYGVSRPSYDQEQDLSQLTQNQEFSQLTAGNQQRYRGNSRPAYDQEEDLTQQTQNQEFSQLTAGNQQGYRGRPRPGYEQEEDLTQQTQKEDLSQTNAGNQINQIPAYSRQKYTHEEDLSQLAQSSDVSQQTLASVSELDDLTQQTQKVDYSQVTSGRQVLPPSSSGYGVSRPSYDQEQDLSQLTQNQEFSQLTAGNQQGYRGRPRPGYEQEEDLTQQTQKEDLSQTTAGSQINPIPAYSRQKYTHEEDLSQQTQSSDVSQQTLASVSELDDLTQQTQKVDYSQVTSGRQVLPPSSSGYGVSRPLYDQEQDLSQLTQNQEFSQLTAGNQQGYRGRPRPGYDQEEDLTQQTQKEDFSQLTVGNQQGYRGHSRPGYDQEEDLTQQTQKEDLSRLTVGNQHARPEYEEDLTQQTQQEDLSQQIVGEQRIPSTGYSKYLRNHKRSAHDGDLSQQTQIEDLTQQTQHEDFGQQTQREGYSRLTSGMNRYRPVYDQQEYLTQQTQHEDLVQQTEKEDLSRITSVYNRESTRGYQSHRTYQQKEHFMQGTQVADLTQQTEKEYLSQMTAGYHHSASGGSQSQQKYEEEELTQQTQHEDLTQQTHKEDLSQLTERQRGISTGYGLQQNTHRTLGQEEHTSHLSFESQRKPSGEKDSHNYSQLASTRPETTSPVNLVTQHSGPQRGDQSISAIQPSELDEDVGQTVQNYREPVTGSSESQVHDLSSYNQRKPETTTSGTFSSASSHSITHQSVLPIDRVRNPSYRGQTNSHEHDSLTQQTQTEDFSQLASGGHSHGINEQGHDITQQTQKEDFSGLTAGRDRQYSSSGYGSSYRQPHHNAESDLTQQTQHEDLTQQTQKEDFSQLSLGGYSHGINEQGHDITQQTQKEDFSGLTAGRDRQYSSSGYGSSYRQPYNNAESDLTQQTQHEDLTQQTQKEDFSQLSSGGHSRGINEQGHDITQQTQKEDFSGLTAGRDRQYSSSGYGSSYRQPHHNAESDLTQQTQHEDLTQQTQKEDFSQLSLGGYSHGINEQGHDITQQTQKEDFSGLTAGRDRQYSSSGYESSYRPPYNNAESDLTQQTQHEDLTQQTQKEDFSQLSSGGHSRGINEQGHDITQQTQKEDFSGLTAGRDRQYSSPGYGSSYRQPYNNAESDLTQQTQHEDLTQQTQNEKASQLTLASYPSVGSSSGSGSSTHLYSTNNYGYQLRTPLAQYNDGSQSKPLNSQMNLNVHRESEFEDIEKESSIKTNPSQNSYAATITEVTQAPITTTESPGLWSRVKSKTKDVFG